MPSAFGTSCFARRLCSASLSPFHARSWLSFHVQSLPPGLLSRVSLLTSVFLAASVALQCVDATSARAASNKHVFVLLLALCSHCICLPVLSVAAATLRAYAAAFSPTLLHPPLGPLHTASDSSQLVWARLAILALTPARSRSLPNHFLPRRNHRSKPVRRGLNALLIARSWKAQTILHTYPSTPLLRTLKVFVSSRAVCSRRLPRFAAKAGSSLSFLAPTTAISRNLVSGKPRIKPRTCLLQILFPTSPSASLLPWYSWVPRQFFFAPWSSVRNGILLPLLSLLSSYPKASSPASRIGPISWLS